MLKANLKFESNAKEIEQRMSRIQKEMNETINEARRKLLESVGELEPCVLELVIEKGKPSTAIDGE